MMEFHLDMIVIMGHNGATVTDDGLYYLFFGGYEHAAEYNGIIVKEAELEMAINHEVLHYVLDSIGDEPRNWTTSGANTTSNATSSSTTAAKWD